MNRLEFEPPNFDYVGRQVSWLRAYAGWLWARVLKPRFCHVCDRPTWRWEGVHNHHRPALFLDDDDWLCIKDEDGQIRRLLRMFNP